MSINKAPKKVTKKKAKRTSKKEHSEHPGIDLDLMIPAIPVEPKTIDMSEGTHMTDWDLQKVKNESYEEGRADGFKEGKKGAFRRVIDSINEDNFQAAKLVIALAVDSGLSISELKEELEKANSYRMPYSGMRFPYRKFL